VAGKRGKMPIRTHRDLEVWKKSMDFAELIFHETKKFPKDETYGLISQLRRSAISIVSNIAEGAARESSKEFIHFLYIALGSLVESETQLLLAKRFQYITDEGKFLNMIGEIRGMILGLIKYKKQRQVTSDK